MSPMLRRLAVVLDALERGLLATLGATMVALALLQIALRAFGIGWPWIEPLLGVLLLWTALAGAVAATGQHRHIAMDLLGHLLRRRAGAALRVPVNLFAAGVCGALTSAAVAFIRLQSETETGRLFGRPIWWASIAIPLAFALMAARFLLHAALAAREATARAAPAPPDEPPP
ncbi:MAG: TRAP transporter small permease subunit [Kiritimatiellae bacterium]|nr:TRAP transporter small permease subunit [Kiritimatiellia bacterium]